MSDAKHVGEHLRLRRKAARAVGIARAHRENHVNALNREATQRRRADRLSAELAEPKAALLAAEGQISDLLDERRKLDGRLYL